MAVSGDLFPGIPDSTRFLEPPVTSLEASNCGFLGNDKPLYPGFHKYGKKSLSSYRNPATCVQFCDSSNKVTDYFLSQVLI